MEKTVYEMMEQYFDETLPADITTEEKKNIVDKQCMIFINA